MHSVKFFSSKSIFRYQLGLGGISNNDNNKLAMKEVYRMVIFQLACGLLSKSKSSVGQNYEFPTECMF